MRNENLVTKVIDIQYHRNGIAGAGFHVILFKSGKQNMMGVVFEDVGYCAVFDTDMLNAGNIKFGSNSWRGDNYEPELRNAIKKYRDNL